MPSGARKRPVEAGAVREQGVPDVEPSRSKNDRGSRPAFSHSA